MILSEFRDIALSQNEALPLKESGLERSALNELPDIQSHALVVCGVRRCGKSTLLHQFVKKSGKKFFYFNFDDMRLNDFSVSDFALLDIVIGETGKSLLFFDEIQSVPKWELYIRQKLDEHFQIIATGSNASLLSGELGTKLTGRHITKELFPFSYQEYCRFTRQKAAAESLNAYLASGGFPEYLKSGNPDILSQLQLDILHRDIAVRYKIRDVASLKRLFSYLLSNAAQLVSPSKLTSVIGVRSPTTILEYFSYFELSYLIHLIPRFSWSAKKQSLAPKKIYIVDLGIIHTGSVSFTNNHGALLENFVFNTIRLKTNDIFYFSTKDGECDFIVNPHSQNILCVQVCFILTQDNRTREINGLLAAMDFFDQQKGIIVTMDSKDLIISGSRKIQVIPAWDIKEWTV
ncbi:MAG: ATP-binding protein [Spirochaetaceae bacterium]|jgi:predicted AAA+ superfamily ATPase|nr:ATP-binding protein [Spirochaetaceae bacterium]